MTNVRGYIFELFCSIQGEGIHVGERQIFVRTAGCSATCYWCDTLPGKQRRSFWVVHGAEKRTFGNPATVGHVLSEVLALKKREGPVRTVSVTGGEPLEQPEFVGSLASALRKAGCRVYLETNGLETTALSKVIESIDVVAMDIKLPSATGLKHWDAHRDFLRTATRTDVFVKVVVDHSTPLEELEEAVELVSQVDPSLPVVFQPESGTFIKGTHGAPARKQLLSLLEVAQERALSRLSDVRVIPQCHKLLMVR